MEKTKNPLALTQQELSDIYSEIDEQPQWRHVCDEEMDYADGNQLDSDLLKKQSDLGIPPAIEDMIGPTLRAVQGYEVNSRTDWRVTADGAIGGQDVADALNYRLNQAERQSKADRACSEAFKPEIGCGIGWVEVSRESNPFLYPYRCKYVHRNEIHWDMRARELDLSDARWLKRHKWLRPERLELLFPKDKELFDAIGESGPNWWDASPVNEDGGISTGLQNAWNETRGYTLQEAAWYNRTTKEVCLSEVWYRRWISIPVLKRQGIGSRAVEYDESNEAHQVAVATGQGEVVQAVIPRVRYSYWLGPHSLADMPSPYQHDYFSYVPFWGFQEDMTQRPYGFVRGMKYPQDSLNSGVSKLRWGMAVARVERTKGAVAMTDAQLRKMVARADADIVLDAAHMAMPGARFEVKRDYQLTQQHYQMLMDNRSSIERVSSISPSFQGAQGTATSGEQESIQVEQSNQALADIMDNFRAGRTQVGELLLSMLIEDIGDQPEEVVIEGDAVTADRVVMLNQPEVDESGYKYLNNDLLRTRLQVALEDVPSTNSYRAQQLAAMSEAVKALPAQYQAAAMPYLAALMDVPFKRELVESLREAGKAGDPAEIEKRVREEVANELKAKELDMKAGKTDAEIKEIEARAVQVGVQAAYSAMQAGSQLVMAPAIAPVADAIMEGAGFQPADPAGIDPNFPVPGQPEVRQPVQPEVRENTSPAFPPVPQQPDLGMDGIETPTLEDNL